MELHDLEIEAAQWRELRTLFGAYLHQDLDVVHGSAWDAVVAFAQESRDPMANVECARELKVLTGSFGDGELPDAVRRLGLDYDPTYDGYSSYRYWLTAVADFLEDPAAHPGPPERDAPVPKTEGAGGRVSTFTDREVAERAVAENLESNRVPIEAWRRSAGPNRAFEWQHDGVVGRLAPPEATPETIHDVDRSRVILRRTTAVAEGWFVMVSYPVAAPDPAIANAIDRSAAEWDALWTLCGGYLHQDFDIHGGVAGAVAAFEADASADQRRSAAAAVRRLLDGGDEAYLAAAAEWLGMDYHPPGDGLTYRGWLTTVAERLGR